jgi:DNA-binding transcriptional LysR family regulator
MDWDNLRYVLAIYRGGTLSAAADDLDVSHTTVGRRLNALEDELGVRLFDRTPEGFLPTTAGADIVDIARQMEDDVLMLEARLMGREAQLEGKLRVTTMDIFFERFQAAFASFTSRYPSIDLTVVASDREVSLVRREADVALRMTNTPPEYLVGQKLGDVRFAVYASNDLVESIGAEADLDEYPWLHWDERLQMRWLDDWLDEHAPNADIVLRTDFSSLLLHRAVAAGYGVHLLACFDADPDPNLRRISPVDTEHARTLWLLTLPELRKNGRVRAFMDHMSDALRDEFP